MAIEGTASVPAGAYSPELLDALEEITVGFILDDFLSEATDPVGGNDDD